MVLFFTLSTENNMTSKTENNELVINLGECLYYVSQIDKIIIQCDINDSSSDISSNSITVMDSTTNNVNTPFTSMKVLDCSKQVLSIFEFNNTVDVGPLSDIRVLENNVRETNTNSDINKSSNTNTYNNDKNSVSFVFYNALSYATESILLTQLQNKFSSSMFVITANFAYPQDFVKNTTLQTSLLDPSQLSDNLKKSNEMPDAPDCASTPYGCCRDGKTISEDILGKLSSTSLFPIDLWLL